MNGCGFVVCAVLWSAGVKSMPQKASRLFGYTDSSSTPSGLSLLELSMSSVTASHHELTSFPSPVRVPLSAFIVEDMNEFVQAHATYRFVILDDDEERPRILVSHPDCVQSTARLTTLVDLVIQAEYAALIYHSFAL